MFACCRPVRSMSVRSTGEELITVSKDAVILWNLKVKRCMPSTCEAGW